MGSPISDLRQIVQEHEAGEHDCKCMERIGFIMQVFYPDNIEFAFSDDFSDEDMESYLESERVDE